MSPTDFPQANVTFGPPADMHREQVAPIRAYVGTVKGGTCDGAHNVVTAWTPTPQELADLNEGKPVFLSFLGGLPPHFACTNFEEAIRPA